MSINIFGVVGVDVRASDIITKIQNSPDPVEVNIMSPGGSVPEGLAIYDTLRDCDKKIITRAIGQAASIGSVIFMAGDERIVGDNAQVMVHNASIPSGGNKQILSEKLEFLNNIDTKLINIYASRTNLNEDQVRALLDKETFMDADEAVDKGFATSKADALALVAQYNKEKEPVIMATEEETKAGFLSHMMAYFKSDAKAEDIPEEDAKAEGDDVPEEEVDKAKAMEEEPKPEAMEEEEEPKAEEEEELDPVAMKAKIEALEKELVEANAKAENEPKAVKEEAKNIANSVFDAVINNKVTLHEAKSLCSKSLLDVEAVLKDKSDNATNLGKSETPKEEPKQSAYDRYSAISDPAERSTFFAANKDEIINQSKES